MVPGDGLLALGGRDKANRSQSQRLDMLTIVSDLILTDAFFIKGQVENKYTR